MINKINKINKMYKKEVGLAWLQEFGSRLNIIYFKDGKYGGVNLIDQDYVVLYKNLYQKENQNEVDDFYKINFDNCNFERNDHFMLKYSFTRGLKNIEYMSSLYMDNNKKLELIKEMKKVGIDYKHFVGEKEWK